MKREKETEFSPTPLNPVFGIDMNGDEIQNETLDGSAEMNENE